MDPMDPLGGNRYASANEARGYLVTCAWEKPGISGHLVISEAFTVLMKAADKKKAG